MTHTKEPWEAIDCGNDAEWDVVKPDAQAIDGHWFVATCHDCADGAPASANARRIVSCVNALAGKPDPAAYVAAMDAAVDALQALFDNYKELADSGDAGNWYLENQPVGKQALAALQSARAAKGDA